MTSASTRIITAPADLDFDSPGRRDYWVALEHDSIWGEHFIPLTVWVGPEAQPGKGLVAFGANHGNEYEGPVALKKLAREIQLEDVRGRIIFVPVLNPSAFWSGKRESRDDDGVNLNRAFVEDAGTHPALNGITHRIAAFVRECIWPHVHVVLDLHSGGQVARFALNTSFYYRENCELARLSEETARGHGTPFVVAIRDAAPGYLPSEAHRLGKITIGHELGWGESVNEDGVRYGRQGVLCAAMRHGQLRGDCANLSIDRSSQKLVTIPSLHSSTRAPYAGHYEPLLPCGAKVEQGQTVGLLHDFGRIDEEPFPVRAALPGYVIAQAWGAPVRQGQWVLLVAKEFDSKKYSHENHFR